jgi:hypothetical protein
MSSFFNLNNSHIQESLVNHVHFGTRFLFLNESYTGYAPSFKCKVGKCDLTHQYYLNVITIQENATVFLGNFYFGLIESSAKKLWNMDVFVEQMDDLNTIFGKTAAETQDANNNFLSNDANKYILSYRVELVDDSSLIDHFISGSTLSDDPEDSFISVETFRSVFPFTILIDRTLTIRQVGDGLIRHLGYSVKQGYSLGFLTYFDIVSPKLNEYSFESILINDSMSYVLKMKSIDNLKSNQFKDMELKGSFMHVEESECLLFIGSPAIQHLEELTGRGLYISDIPIHDATRDIILVGEQTKAQVTLFFLRY